MSAALPRPPSPGSHRSGVAGSRPGPVRTAADPADAASRPPAAVTIRMVVDAAELAVASQLIRELSSRVYRPSSRHQFIGEHAAQLEWLDYQGGSFDGLPMRLEVLAVAAATVVRDAVLEAADVVIIVADGADLAELRRRQRRTPAERRAAGPPDIADSAPGRRSLDGRIAELARLRQRRAELDRPAIVLFEHGDGREPSVSTAALLRGFGLPADTLSTATATDGAGLRYGVALAVRAGVHRLRARDAAQLPRTPAAEPDGLWRALPGPAAAAARRPAPARMPTESPRREVPESTPLLSALTARGAPHPPAAPTGPPAPSVPPTQPAAARAAATTSANPPSGRRVAHTTLVSSVPAALPPPAGAEPQRPGASPTSPSAAAPDGGSTTDGPAVADAATARPDGRRRALARLIAALRG